ncbi:hypothetical protein DPMN_122260 [Dreissena polymorpha]|uniref:Uncharacterized protein n=1 Tax=Dreissena polymorpha TaxID=45954 RepID=A0A9D4GN89_DREPO|nr:hypothetical protein DPMN_122260 [Dreissena polymorpha]
MFGAKLTSRVFTSFLPQLQTFELDQYVIRTNVLTKCHNDCKINLLKGFHNVKARFTTEDELKAITKARNISELCSVYLREYPSGFPLPIRSTRSSRSPKFPDKTRPSSTKKGIHDFFSTSCRLTHDPYTTHSRLDLSSIATRSSHDQIVMRSKINRSSCMPSGSKRPKTKKAAYQKAVYQKGLTKKAPKRTKKAEK